MNKIIAEKIDMLYALCRRYHIKSLYLFGSANTDDFNENSDIDLLVTFDHVDLFHYFENYMGLKDALEKLFNRTVDLLEEKTIRNPIFRRSIDRNKKLIYG